LLAKLALIGTSLIAILVVSSAGNAMSGPPAPPMQKLGAWSATRSYPLAVVGQSCVAYSSFVYCVGGETASGQSVTNTYYAQMTPNGTSNWVSGPSYPLPVEQPSCVVVGSRIYCIGGGTQGNQVPVKNVFYAQVSQYGVGAWTPASSYPAAVFGSSCVAASVYIYCTLANSLPVRSSYWGLVVGSNIDWKPGPSYPVETTYESCSADSNDLYCVGGYGVGEQVYSARIANGTFGSWNNETVHSHPQAPLWTHSCIVYSQYVYCMGGGPTNQVVYSAPLSNETVGPWNALGQYPTQFAEGSCVAGQPSGIPTVYCIDRTPTVGQPAPDTVYYAPIVVQQASTGAVTSTLTMTTTVPTTVVEVENFTSTASRVTTSTVTDFLTSTRTETMGSSTGSQRSLEVIAETGGGVPIAGVYVTLTTPLGGQSETATNSSGDALFPGLVPAKGYVVSAVLQGATLRVNVNLAGDTVVVLDPSLASGGSATSTVSVSSHSPTSTESSSPVGGQPRTGENIFAGTSQGPLLLVGLGLIALVGAGLFLGLRRRRTR
jgi:hypothetical protein